jgi:hypothetical protein
MRAAWLVLAVVAGACVTPRSLAVGQLAAPVGPGATEVSVFGGVGYASQQDPPTTTVTAAGDTVRTQATSRVLGAPMAEANVQYGFTEHLGLNVHLSPAGLEPGLKWTLTSSKVAHVALLPALGLGYGSVAQSTLTTNPDGTLSESAPGATTSFVFLGALKVLVSHRSGFFAGVGYAFFYQRSLASLDRGTAASGDRSQVLTETTSHQLSASVGFDVALGPVHLRPEVAFGVYPGIARTTTVQLPVSSAASTSSGGGFAWAIFPGLSIAVASPRRAVEAADDDEDRATLRGRRRGGDAEDEEDDEEPAPARRRAPRNPPPEDDD